ncbi:MAG: hypothetical protein Q4C20_12255 [Erysipelotrichaceae bacterium]|nr:hypothetical protein [Erysipelotrichaceae bacterium]
MNYEEVVSNVNVYGLEESVKGSKSLMTVDQSALGNDSADKKGKHAKSNSHDSFMNGIIVQFDLTFTNKAWVDAERYHFLEFVSSQSTMHRITKFDLDQAYNEYVDTRIVEIMKEKVAAYNELQADIKNLKAEGKDVTTLNDVAAQKYLEILYSNPAGFRMTARMSTNYRQLRTIYHQRKAHRLPEWRAFCRWIETLPHSEFITDMN